MSDERHVVKAWKAMQHSENNNKFFIEIENATNEKGIAPVVKFKIQSDPIGEVGVNGCQAVDMLEYIGHLFSSLNSTFPCEENEETIKCINEALVHQEQRTADREVRKVEGTNKI